MRGGDEGKERGGVGRGGGKELKRGCCCYNLITSMQVVVIIGGRKEVQPFSSLAPYHPSESLLCFSD